MSHIYRKFAITEATQQWMFTSVRRTNHTVCGISPLPCFFLAICESKLTREPTKMPASMKKCHFERQKGCNYKRRVYFLPKQHLMLTWKQSPGVSKAFSTTEFLGHSELKFKLQGRLWEPARTGGMYVFLGVWWNTSKRRPCKFWIILSIGTDVPTHTGA